MADILHTIVKHKRREVAARMATTPAAEMKARAEAAARPTISMSRSIAESASGIIAEFKRRSPSKGWIRQDARPEMITPDYQRNGAAALSILTDSEFFGGSTADITAARGLVSLPILRKDFVVDPYQIYEARAIGADAVLLIAAVLTREECGEFTATAHSLGLEVLLEIHSEEELGHISPRTDMVGVNNRHLGTFITDVAHSFALAESLPKDKVLVSESGISKPESLRGLRRAGFRGFLIGETFMKAADPGLALRKLTEASL